MGFEQVVVIAMAAIAIGTVMKYLKKTVKIIVSIAIAVVALVYVGYISIGDVKSIGDVILEFIKK